MNLSAVDSNMTKKFPGAPHLPAFGMKQAGFPAIARKRAYSPGSILDGRPPISRSTS